MTKEKIAVMVDSGCDLSREICRENSIYLLPFIIQYDGEEERFDPDVDPQEIYARYPVLPKTSTPSIQAVEEMVEQIKRDGYDKLIAIHISPKLSSTISTVSFVLSEHPEIESFVVDTKNISIACGLIGLWAAHKVREGMGFAELCEQLPKKVSDSRVYFYMDTLDYLKAGGRIGGVTATVGSLFKVRPIICCDDEGKYRTAAIVRGDKNAKKKLLELATEFSGGENFWFGYMEGGGGQAYKEFRPAVMEAMSKGKLVLEDQIMATLAANTGPGLIGIGVIRNS